MATTDASLAFERILPYIISGTSYTLSVVSVIVHFLAFIIFKTLDYISYLSPYHVILYFLAPVLVFFEVIVNTFFRIPYAISHYFFDVLYPVYVFCGVACITGALIGATGRLVSSLMVNAVQNGGGKSKLN